MPNIIFPKNLPATEALKNSVIHHPVINAIQTPRDLQIFMQHHIICVFDFMSLVKSLQQKLASNTNCWLPSGNRNITRFINEIMLDEESDMAPDGKPLSHFEWYLHAMAETGADATPIIQLIEKLERQISMTEALQKSSLPQAAVNHCQIIQEICAQPVDVVANVFYHSRESIIPAMFHNIVAVIEQHQLDCPWLKSYLERHMACDSEVHGPMAKQMVDYLNKPQHRQTYEHWISQALSARLALYEAAILAIKN